MLGSFPCPHQAGWHPCSQTSLSRDWRPLSEGTAKSSMKRYIKTTLQHFQTPQDLGRDLFSLSCAVGTFIYHVSGYGMRYIMGLISAGTCLSFHHPGQRRRTCQAHWDFLLAWGVHCGVAVCAGKGRPKGVLGVWEGEVCDDSSSQGVFLCLTRVGSSRQLGFLQRPAVLGATWAGGAVENFSCASWVCGQSFSFCFSLGFPEASSLVH